MKLNKQTVAVLLAGFLVVGGAAGTVFDLFGTVDGTADVTQAIQLDGTTGQASTSHTYDSVTGGDVLVANHYLQNNQDEVMSVDVSTNSSDGLGVTYRYVDELVNETVTRTDKDFSYGDMRAEFDYNSNTDKAGIHAYGKTVYNSEASNSEAVSRTGLQFTPEDATFTGSNTITVDYSVGDRHRESQTTDGTTPDWIKYRVNYSGTIYTIANFTVDEKSGTTMTFDSSASTGSFGNDAVVINTENPSNNTDIPSITELKDSEPEIVNVFVGTGSGADDEHYVDLWYYGVQFNGEEQIAERTGNYVKDLESGRTDLGIFAETSQTSSGELTYSSQFAPVTQ